MTEEEIHKICEKFDIKNYTINNDMTIDVNSHVELDDCVTFFNVEISKLPVNFNKVSGDFDCSANELITLKGCPKIVEGFFKCTHNNLKSLKYSPEYIEGEFACENNDLKTLDYLPQRGVKEVFASNNKITSLKGLPNNLVYVDVENNNIRSLDGFTKDTIIKTEDIHTYLILNENQIYELFTLFGDIEHIEYFNELDIIQENGEVVILDRLNYFLTDIGRNEVKKERIKNYTVFK